MNDYLKNVIEKPKKVQRYEINRKNKTITINGVRYGYNAFSILGDGIKIYKGNEIFVKF